MQRTISQVRIVSFALRLIHVLHYSYVRSIFRRILLLKLIVSNFEPFTGFPLLLSYTQPPTRYKLDETFQGAHLNLRFRFDLAQFSEFPL